MKRLILYTRRRPAPSRENEDLREKGTEKLVKRELSKKS